MTCNGPDNNPGASAALEEGPPDPELADDASRLQTFSAFPSDCPISPSALAHAGFVYTGQRDKVECFRCHVTAEGWRQGDSAAERHQAVSPGCPFVNGLPSGGTCTHSLRSGSQQGAENCLAVNARPPPALEPSSALQADYLLRSGQVVDLSGSLCPRSPAMCSKEARLGSFQDWPPDVPVAPADLAAAGLYHTGVGDEVECFCCGGRLRNWEPGDQAWSEHRRHFPRCFFVLGHDVGNIGVTPGPPGDGPLHRGGPPPQNPSMADYEARVNTFATWNYLVDREALARAGFYSLGNGDSVECFHCGGGLQEWKAYEDPWEQHAKWFPGCKYVIEEKGQAFVNSIHLTHSLQGSTIEEEEKTSLTEEKDLLQDNVVQNAVHMGFSLDEIRKAMERKRHLSAESYRSIEALVGDLIHAQQENVPHRSWEKELSTEEKLRRLQEEKLCKICMDKSISVVLIPCGHLVACEECARAVDRCPLCCAEIAKRQKIYTS